MNKRTVIAELNKIANELDNSGMFNEATEITSVMKKIAQFTPPAAAPAPVPVAQPSPVAPPFGAPVVPAMPAAPGAVPALGAPMQPAAPAAPVTNTTKPPYATSAGAQGTPAPQANPADPNAAAESVLYQQKINEIAGLLKTKNPMDRTKAQQIYEDTFVQLKFPKRKQAFANQFQNLVTQNFAAKYNQGPTQK
jgi:hypothetical protein